MVSARRLGVAGLFLVGGVALLVRGGDTQLPLWGVVALAALGLGAWAARLGRAEAVAPAPVGSRRAAARGVSARASADSATDSVAVDADVWHVAEIGAATPAGRSMADASAAPEGPAPLGSLDRARAPAPSVALASREATPLKSPLPSLARIGRAAVVCEELAEARDAAALAVHAVDGLVDATGAFGGAFLRVAEGRLEPVVDRGLLESADFARWDPVMRSLRDGSARRVHIEGAGILVGDCDEVAEFVLVSPILFDGQPHGVLLLAAARPFEPETEAMVDVARATLSVALENARRGEQLSRLAMIDPLTGLFDRRFGTRRLREEVQRALRAGTSVGLLVVDLDHLDTINDDFGRLAGDRLLVQIAHAVRRLLRETDVVVRLGADELLAVLPEASRADTRRVGERIRAEIAQVATMEGDATVSVTASIGANAFPHDPSSTVDDLVAHAEAAARAARDNGGDRVVLALTFEGEAMTLRRTA